MDRLAQQGATKEEQEMVMSAHERELQNLINKIDADKLRMQSSLQDKIQKRRLVEWFWCNTK